MRSSFFPSNRSLFVRLVAFVFLAWGGALHAAEWQWSAAVPAPISRPGDNARAFLWIPEGCQRVRGIVFGQHNMQEEALMEHPVFRKTLQELGFAAVWVVPGFDLFFRADQDAETRLNNLLKELATTSGYTELADAPLVPIGHSAAAMMPWYMAAWNPDRIIAGISMSGQWPYYPNPKDAPQAEGVSIDAVPGLVTIGEYEWADQRMGDGVKTRADHPAMPLSALGCPADGHFYLTDEKATSYALYLKKAVQYRLPKQTPASAPVKLNPIDTAKTGWLVDRYRFGKYPSAPTAPVGQYKGDPAQAFWFFDEDLAKAAEAFQSSHRGEPALLGYMQNGAVQPQVKGTHQQVTIPFKPEADGVTFKLIGAFLDTVPEGRPEKWTGKKAGESITPPPAPVSTIQIERITGPIRKISADTWELAFDRTSFLGDRRGNEGWLAAVWPDSSPFKRAIQQSMVTIPRQYKGGTPQTISFELPSTLRYGTRELKLSAKSSADLPVRFFVREGPAEIVGDKLVFSPVPPRAKFPVTVTVVAWQFGRDTDPKVQTAEPVACSFTLTR